MKTSVVDVGGGFRGIYACGALYYCLDEGIRFDLGIGVSAGSANLASRRLYERAMPTEKKSNPSCKSSMKNKLHVTADPPYLKIIDYIT